MLEEPIPRPLGPLLGGGERLARRGAAGGDRLRRQAQPATGEPDFTCADTTWAAIAMGDLKASTAAALGLAACTDHRKLPLLDTLSQGPLPFCREYF